MNPRTTLAGLVTAVLTIILWAINAYWFPLPAEVRTFIITGAVTIIALFADPNGYKEVKPNIFVIITTIVTITGYVLNIFHIVLPDIIIAGLQAICIYLFGYFLKDAKPLPKY